MTWSSHTEEWTDAKAGPGLFFHLMAAKIMSRPRPSYFRVCSVESPTIPVVFFLVNDGAIERYLHFLLTNLLI